MAAAPTQDKQFLVPYITVAGGLEAIEYYKKAFGAQVTFGPMLADDGKKVMHAQLKINGSMLYISDDFPEYHGGKPSDPHGLGGSPVSLHINVPDCDAAVEAARAAAPSADKFKVTMPPGDMFWGDRYAQFVDPFGHKWSVTTPISAERTEKAKKAHEDWKASKKPKPASA